jgi:quinoprotein glucose dehydrogenase
MNKPVLLVSAFALVASGAFRIHAAEVSGSGAKTGELKPFDRAPVHPPKDTPDAAAKNLAKAKIPAGFTADIWAAEPLLANPVAFCFDPRGRMFVSETHRIRSSNLDIRHYMFMLEDDLASRNQDDWLASIQKNLPKDWQDLAKESEVVRLVEDSNGDGKADKSSVYADGFRSPLDGCASGVLWYNDALYFANIPALWKLSGVDKAEKREEVHRGYGIRFSYTGHDLHGLIIGPDGRLYFSIGDRGSSVKTKEGTVLEVPDEGAVFRCEPDGTHLELVMRGLRNPQELAFDNYGNLFTGDNDSDQGDRERWVYVVEGGDAGWRIGYQHHPLGNEFNPWLAEHMWEPRDAKKNQPSYILSPLANLPDGPSGLAYYPGTGLPAEYAGSYFLAGYKGSTAKSAVNTFKSVPDGASFRLEGLHVFMDNVQATDVAFGPDSRLYVSAWDEGWERTDQGRIYRLSHEAARKEQAAQIAEVEKILAEGFAKRSPEELAKLLGHADQRVRFGAQWASEAKRIDALLSKVALGTGGAGQRLARLHAIWALGNIARRANSDIVKSGPSLLKPIYTLAKDPDPEVRTQFFRALEETSWSFAEETKAILEGLKDESLRVRMAACLALKRHGRSWDAPAVLALLRENDGKDLYLQHAGVITLANLGNIKDALAAAAKDPSRAVRLGVLLVYCRLGDAAVAQFLADKDPALAREAAIAINDTPIPSALPALAKFDLTKTKDPMLTLRVLNANFRTDTPESATTLADFCRSNAPENLRLTALEMLTHWANPPARDYVVGIYRPLPKRGPNVATEVVCRAAEQLLADKSEKIAIAECAAISANHATSAAPALLEYLQNEKAPVKVRVAALNALAAIQAPELDMALAVATADAQPALKTAASKFLGKRDPAAAAKQLIEAYAGADMEQKKDILSALGDNPSPAAGEKLTALMREFAKQPPAAQLELLEAAEKHPGAKAAAAAWRAALPKDDALAPFTACVTGGDAEAGEKLFKEHAIAACMRCHKVGNAGGDAGPALDGIAARKDRRYILESIVAPNAAIADGFQMVVLTLKDGVVAGFLKKETEAELTIQPPGEAAKTIKKADVKQRDTAPSGMLPNLAELLSKRELRDLVEYCATLK